MTYLMSHVISLNIHMDGFISCRIVGYSKWETNQFVTKLCLMPAYLLVFVIVPVNPIKLLLSWIIFLKRKSIVF
jgi:hypothetical protein